MIGTIRGITSRALPIPRLPVPSNLWTKLAHHRLSTVLRNAREISFDDNSRLVFFSDCHRGDRSRNDAFAGNEVLFLHALDHYYQRGFSYVEVGDGDELWQNRRFRDVLQAHWPTFDMLHRFDLRDRLHLIWGNHDLVRRGMRACIKDGIQGLEALVLRHARTGQRLLVTHGHQADIASDRLQTFSRLIVRHIWRRIQGFGVARFFVPAEREQAIQTLEQRLTAWIQAVQIPVICGHTHRASLSAYADEPYFNTGSWIKPGEATGLELQGGELSLVRWTSHPVTHEVRRELLDTPRQLRRWRYGLAAS